MNTNDKKRLWSLFQNVPADELQKGINKESDSHILLVDGLNTFIRAWMSSPAMNENGEHTGGISAFLKSVGYAIKLIKPTKVIIVFDGKGGSQKRRKIYSGYKQGRRTNVRLNRTYDNVTLDETSMKRELIRTIEYLDTLPVTTISVDNIEADDTIAYLTTDTFKDQQITIMSADKDFLQLVNDNVTVWSPTKKKLYGCHDIHKEYGVSCRNFIFYRILEGDTSDNINGIKGAGLKTILKCFPFLSEEKQVTLDEIYTFAENHQDRYKLYRTILDEKLLIERNYQLMQLHDTQIQSFTQLRIEDVIKEKPPTLNKMQFTRLITEDQMWNNIPNYVTWINEVFGKLDYFNK